MTKLTVDLVEEAEHGEGRQRDEHGAVERRVQRHRSPSRHALHEVPAEYPQEHARHAQPVQHTDQLEHVTEASVR